MSKKDLNNKIRLDFNGQRDGEKVLFVFRRHMVAMEKGFILLAVPLIVTAIPPLIWSSNLELFLLPIFGFILGLILFFYQFILWYFTIYIVTDQRIRQITQRSMFGRDVVELKLSKIQNISYNIPGFGGEVLKYGTIIIQTFVGDMVIHNVDHPSETYNKLQDAISNVNDNRANDEEDI